MIIIITGATHTGKTILSQKILEQYFFPYLSLDHLKMGLIRSKYTELTTSSDLLVDYLWPITREIIKTAIENKQNLIIEGCYIPFKWKNDFEENYLKEIKFICLVMTCDYINTNYRQIVNHANDIEKRIDDSYCSIDLLIKENNLYLESCIQNNLPYYLINNFFNYNDIIKDIFE